MDNILIEVTQRVMISRYFTATGVVIVLYDTILTIEDEVSGFSTQESKFYSLSTGSPGLGRAVRRFEATLLHQPVLDNFPLDSCQLPWVTPTRRTFENLHYPSHRWVSTIAVDHCEC